MCVACGRAIEWYANVCPYCGRDYRAQMMPAYPVSAAPVKTAMPVVGGVLVIIGGVISLGLFFWLLYESANLGSTYEFTDFGWALLALSLLCAIFSLLGGIVALIRKYLPLAILGAIASILGFGIFGIIGLILIAVSHKEFH